MLVPGDVVLLQRPDLPNIAHSGKTVLFDGILLNGECVMQEATLTGESVPVTKTALPGIRAASEQSSDCNTIFSIQKHSSHVLFAGTQIIQCNPVSVHDPITVLVVRTGKKYNKKS